MTVRDQRNREHDPILGVVPLKLTDILETSSQVTRWYPLDGGIGFGRIRISLLFRSIEVRLPPQQLGWDVGTLEFLSKKIVATDYSSTSKLKMRTGGSVGRIDRKLCHAADGGLEWDLSDDDTRAGARLPVLYRYRSPVVFEFHTAGKMHADAYAVFWLQHLIDNEPTDIDIPIWKTDAPARITQNYITEKNWTKDMPGLEDLETVGRLKFTACFKAGMDDSHEKFVTSNDGRETYETWEACLADGVRERLVEKEVSDRVQGLHDDSLTQGRDVLQQADAKEKKKWLSKDGQDWSGAFGHDPKAYLDSKGRKRREPGVDAPLHDPHNPSSDEDDDDAPDSDSASDLGIIDGSDIEPENGNAAREKQEKSETADKCGTEVGRDDARQQKRTMSRKHRGLMQWKPARNAKFAKDEGIIGAKKLFGKITGGLDGRQPGVETET